MSMTTKASRISEATDSSPTIGSGFNFPYLPEGLRVEILWRLPLKSLTQMTIVCKSWRNIIRSPEFLALRRKNHYSSPKYPSSSSSDLLLMRKVQGIGFEYGIVLLGSLNDDAAAGDDSATPIHFMPGFPSSRLPRSLLYDYPVRLRIVGLCNGMICIYDLDHSDLLIWNHLTQYSSIIRNPLLHHQRAQNCSYISYILIEETAGFGFDPKMKDYKILHMVQLAGNRAVTGPSAPRCDYWLYSLSSNSWKKLEFNSEFFPEFWPNVNYEDICSLPFTDNRIICWLASSVAHRPLFKDRRVVLFDMSTETFDFIPVEVQWEAKIFGRPFAFMETIALLAVHSTSSQQRPDVIVNHGFHVFENHGFDILLLDDFCSTRSSWCKFFSISIPSSKLMPLGVGKLEQFLFQDANGELILFNPYNCLVTKTGVCKPRMYSVFVFKESSVSVNE